MAPHLLTPGPRRRCSVERRVCVEPLGSPGRPIPEPRSSLFPPSLICLTQDDPLLVSAFQFLRPVLASAALIQGLWKASAKEGLEVDGIYCEKHL